MEIQFTVHTIVLAIIKLFVLMLGGYFLYQFKVINDEFVDRLSAVLVKLIFPALIISKTITYFSFADYHDWWILPCFAVIFSIVGMFIGKIVFSFLKRSDDTFTSQKEFITSCGFQNCGYLPMNLILFSFTGLVQDRLLIYLFLFIVGFNVLMWTLIPLYLAGRLRQGFKWYKLFNPPVAATVFSLAWVALLGKGTMPGVIMDPLKQLGQASFPIAMITLGAYLNRYKAHIPQARLPLIASLIVKLAIFPLIVLAAVKLIPGESDLKFFLFLQAIMPTAVSLVVIGSYTNADNKFFSSTIFYSHLISIVTIPLWLAVFLNI